MNLSNSPLGQHSDYVDHYDATLLFAIERSRARAALNLGCELPFVGEDVWNAWELSWLAPSGKPAIAIAEIRVPCHSDLLVESKSLKLYLNSFANSRFDSSDQVEACISRDLSALLGANVSVRLRPLEEPFVALPVGVCIDDIDVDIECYEVAPSLLTAAGEVVTERLYSHLLRSRCPVTGQPDWATLSISYSGAAIDRAGLLKYLVSFRNHQGFHEQLVEQIFLDLQQHCAPDSLTVYGRFTRRGGVDINPWRSTEVAVAPNWREIRQ